MWFEGDNEVIVRVVNNHKKGENKLQAILCGEHALFTHKTIAKFVTKYGHPEMMKWRSFVTPCSKGDQISSFLPWVP